MATGTDLVERRMKALCATLTKTDRIISGVNVRVESDPGHKTAWTDGSGIHISGWLMNQAAVGTPAKVMELLGVNYHELCHVLWTNFEFSNETIRQIRQDYLNTSRPWWWDIIKSAWNILEDQRVEARWVSMFNPEALSYGVLKTLKDSTDPTNPGAMWPLIAGRVWLSGEYRAMVRKGFVAQFSEDLADRFKDTIGQYQRLDLRNPNAGGNALETREAEKRIIVEFMELLREVSGDTDPDSMKNLKDIISAAAPPDDGETFKHGTLDVPRDLLERLLDDDDKADDGADGSAPFPGEPGDDTDESGEGESGEGEPGEGEPGEDESGEGEPGGDTDGASNTGGLTGAGDSDPVPEPDELIDALFNDLDQAGDALTGDVERIRASIDRLINSGRGIHPRPVSHTNTAVTAEARVMATKLADEFRRFRDSAERGWVPSGAGRLNTNRVISSTAMGTRPREVFDSFEDDSDGVSLNVVVLLDISGSISAPNDVAVAGWAIKTAVDQVDGSCEVIAFNNETAMVYSGDVDAPRSHYRAFRVGGGTNPYESLKYASMRLLDGREGIPVLVVVTDGAWNRQTDIRCDETIAELNGAGVTTVLYGLDNAVRHHGHHNCTFSADTPTMARAVDLFKQVVTGRMESRVAV